MDTCYVRIWGAQSGRVFGWLGISDNYAACIPAGVYSNPLKLDGVLPIQWRPGSNPGEGIVAAPLEGGDYGLGGANSGGVDAYWHWVSRAYTLMLTPVPGLKLASPVPGIFSGTLAQLRDNSPFALYCNYGINEDAIGLSFHDAPIGPYQIFSKQDVYLEFTTEAMVFEFVPVSAFDPNRDSYAPGLRSKHTNWRKFDTFSWMGDLSGVIGGRALSELIVPGSHDAASWDIPIAGGDQRSQTQSRQIYDQLRAGSRYLDLRFSSDCWGQWRGFHGLDSTSAQLGPVLADINRFLDENPKEILVISLLSQQVTPDICSLAHLPYVQPDNIWDVVLNTLGPRVFPRRFYVNKNGVKEDQYHYIKNANQSGLLAQGKNIMLFSWGRPPSATVTLNGPLQGQRQDDYIWAATPADPALTPGAEPWKGAFDAAAAQGYELDFDLAGVWINGYSTTANDIRLALGAVRPPGGGPLWMMHVVAPALPGGEWISTKAARIQPPLGRLVKEDPTMTAKLNYVNLDFVGDHPDLSVGLIEANLLR
jgi:hypothetical protein